MAHERGDVLALFVREAQPRQHRFDHLGADAFVLVKCVVLSLVAEGA
jgi:hypothetical protein